MCLDFVIWVSCFILTHVQPILGSYAMQRKSGCVAVCHVALRNKNIILQILCLLFCGRVSFCFGFCNRAGSAVAWCVARLLGHDNCASYDGGVRHFVYCEYKFQSDQLIHQWYTAIKIAIGGFSGRGSALFAGISHHACWDIRSCCQHLTRPCMLGHYSGMCCWNGPCATWYSKPCCRHLDITCQPLTRPASIWSLPVSM